jgi:hypothetical protein
MTFKQKLYLAAESGDLEMVTNLLDGNLANPDWHNPLHVERTVNKFLVAVLICCRHFMWLLLMDIQTVSNCCLSIPKILIL